MRKLSSSISFDETKTKNILSEAVQIVFENRQISLQSKLFKNHFQIQRIQWNFHLYVQKGIQFGEKVNEFDKMLGKNIQIKRDYRRNLKNILISSSLSYFTLI